MTLIRRIGRRGVLTAAATTCTTTALALLTLAFVPSTAPPPPAPPTAQAPAQPERFTAGASPATGLPRSVPVRISAPRVGLTADIEPVSLADNGSIAMPPDPQEAGWYSGSATPGETGNAILVAHVDSHDGPAAFYQLSSLKPGDHLTVDRHDGTQPSFRVTGIAVHPRNNFPTRVYKPTPHPQLTLITCTSWDEATQQYRDNLVITARRATKTA